MLKVASRWLAVAVLILAPHVVFAKPGATTLDDLRQRFIQQFEQSAPEAAVTPMSDGLVVSFDDGREFRLYLDRAVSRVEAGEPVEVVVDGIVASTLAPDPGAFDPSRAFILVRPVEFMTFAEGEAARGMEFVSRPFVGDLTLLLAEDMVDRFVYPTSEVVAETHPDLDAVWRDALARTHDAQGEAALETIDPGIWLMTARWDIASSLLLDDAVWGRPDVIALGEIAVGVFRDALIVVQTDQPRAVAQIRRFLQNMRSDPNYQSDLLFVRRGGAWQVYE